MLAIVRGCECACARACLCVVFAFSRARWPAFYSWCNAALRTHTHAHARAHTHTHTHTHVHTQTPGAGQGRAQHQLHLQPLLPRARAHIRRDGLHQRHRRVERRLRAGGAAAGQPHLPGGERRRPAGGDHQGAPARAPCSWGVLGRADEFGEGLGPGREAACGAARETFGARAPAAAAACRGRHGHGADRAASAAARLRSHAERRLPLSLPPPRRCWARRRARRSTR
jgi:hypothetical protein